MYKLEDSIPFNHYYMGDKKDTTSKDVLDLNCCISNALEELLDNGKGDTEFYVHLHSKKVIKTLKKMFNNKGYYTKYIYGGNDGDIVSVIISKFKF